MKKKIKDLTFDEFAEWSNARACDGRWCFTDAVNACTICTTVYDKTRYCLFKRKKREKLFKELCEEYLNLEAEIEIE